MVRMLQLKKSVRLACLGLPFKRSLMEASRMGAEGIELDARSELRPGELTRTAARHLGKMLSDLNLRVAAVHLPLERGFADPNGLEQRMDAVRQAMEMAFALGSQVVTAQIGSVPANSADPGWPVLLEAMTDLGRWAHRSGAWLVAHSGSDTSERLATLLEALPDFSIGVDFDPAAAMMLGESPNEAIERLGRHVMHFRARDAVRDLSLGQTLEVQLGRGSVDLPHLLAKLEECNYRGYLTVQRAANSESAIQCAQALEYLENLFR